jgi:ATP-binding cassette subfamily B multidrug efflux pump
MSLASTTSARQVLARPFRLLRGHARLVLLGVLLVPVHAAVMLAMPRQLGAALDGLNHAAVGSGFDGRALAATCATLLGLALAEAVSRYLSRRSLIDASRHVEQDLKDELVAHLSELPLSWFDRARTGDLVSRLTQDVELIQFVMGPLLLHGGSALCLLPAGLWLLLAMNVPVTLTCAGVFALLMLSVRLVMPRLHRWSKVAQQAIGDLSQRAQEDFAGIRVVQGFGIQERELAAMARLNRRQLHANLRLARLRAIVNAIAQSSTGVVTLGVVVIGGREVVLGAITVGELFQFITYLAILLPPLGVLGWTLGVLPRALAGARRIEEVFKVEPEPRQGLQVDLQGAVEVRHLTFRYDGQTEPALRDLSFRLAPGQKLGLCGTVGSGKSTLLALCLRFYDPPRGTMFLDGHDVLDLHPDTVRAAFALAPQEPYLFSDTVAANIAFARDALDEPELHEAVRDSALDQDLTQLHQGLETRVGERGVTLSGGQKQRVSLARALASQRRALVLDDTLSAVDPSTERRALEALRRQRRGRTMLVASHRLSVLSDSDLILVLERGRVIERGTHRELLALGGRYAATFHRQEEAAALDGGATNGPVIRATPVDVSNGDLGDGGRR